MDRHGGRGRGILWYVGTPSPPILIPIPVPICITIPILTPILTPFPIPITILNHIPLPFSCHSSFLSVFSSSFLSPSSSHHILTPILTLSPSSSPSSSLSSSLPIPTLTPSHIIILTGHIVHPTLIWGRGFFPPPTQVCLEGSQWHPPPPCPPQVWRTRAGSTPGPSSPLCGAKPCPWGCSAAPGRCEVRGGHAQSGVSPGGVTPSPPQPSRFCHLS